MKHPLHTIVHTIRLCNSLAVRQSKTECIEMKTDTGNVTLASETHPLVLNSITSAEDKQQASYRARYTAIQVNISKLEYLHCLQIMRPTFNRNTLYNECISHNPVSISTPRLCVP